MTDTERCTRGNLPHWYKPGYPHFVTYRLADTIPQEKLRQWRAERLHRIRSPVPAGTTVRAHRERAAKLFFKRYDDFLDRHAGHCWLKQPSVAAVVRENLYHHRGSLYELMAYVIMPNHVHILIQPLEKGLAPHGRKAGDARSADRTHGRGGTSGGGAESGGTDCGTKAGSFGYEAKAASFRTHDPELHDAEYPDERPDRLSVLARIMHSLKSYTANEANKVLARRGQFWLHESYDHWVRDMDELERIIDYIRFNPVKANLCARPQDWRFSSAFDRYEQDGSLCGILATLRDDWQT